MTLIQETKTAEGFAERVFNAGLETIDVFAIYLGEKLGLYRALLSHGPATNAELATYTGVNPRYVREWLEQQTVTGILEVDDPGSGDDRRFSLPPGHAEVLLDGDSLNYLAPFLRMLMAGGIAMPQLLAAYRTGGGVSWADLGADARTGQADMNRPWFLHSIGSDWFPKVDDLHAALTAGGRVADIACGEGWSTIAIALAYTEATVDGYDIDEPSIEAARRNAIEAGVFDRVTFHVEDVAALDINDEYDAVVGFEFVHDLPDPVSVLEAIRRIAKPGAPILVMDENVGHTFTGNRDDVERTMYGFSLFLCLPDGMSHKGSVGTGTVIRLETMRSYARQAGFSDATIQPIENDLWRFYKLS